MKGDGLERDRQTMNDIKIRKIGMRDYELTDYKFNSKACKMCRRRMVKALRSKEKLSVRKEYNI